MLVCNISLRPPRRTIAADLAEAATAADATATGNIVIAALVDAPAAVTDHVDAYIGEIMAEAASATASVDAGLVYVAAILEEVTAVAAQDGRSPQIFTDAVIEAASAGSVVNGSTGPAAVARDAMVAAELTVAFVNSDGTPRDAHVLTTMLNE